MNANSEKLFEELMDLIGEREVQNNLDPKLRERVGRLVEERGREFALKKVREMGGNDHEELFEGTEEEMSQVFEKIVLKDEQYQCKVSGTEKVGSKSNKPYKNTITNK